MGVPLEHHTEETKRLQRCINDLVSVLALPAVWSGGEPSQVVRTLLDALLRMLLLDLVYVRLKDPVGGTCFEMVRLDQFPRPTPRQQEICTLLNRWLGDDPLRRPARVRNPVGNGDISILPLPLGLQGEIGVIVVGSQRADFPRKTESLLLSVAANQASLGLHEARLLSEQKRLAIELEQRIGQRTMELAEANEELRKEIAERKRNENALREANTQVALNAERWRSVFENSAIGVALTDLNGRFLAANPVYEQMLGYTEEELQRLSFLDMTHEEDIEANRNLIGELLAGKRRQFRIEKQYRRKNQSLVWVRNNVSMVRGTERVPQFLMALSEDITVRKEAEAKLRHSEALLAEVQVLSLTGGFSWHTDTDEITLSEEARRIFGFEEDTPVTLERISGRVHPEDAPLLSEKMALSRAGDGDHDYEIRLRMSDGSVKYLHTVSHIIRDREGRTECIGAIQDITQRRLSAEALSKARSELAEVSRTTSLGALTASIAHEVTQPLAAMVTDADSCLQWLAKQPPEIDRARGAAERIVRGGHRAGDVIQSIRALARKSSPDMATIVINRLIGDTLDLMQSELRRHQVLIETRFAATGLVKGDRTQLQQVIVNLVVNAMEAMSASTYSPRVLRITTESTPGGGVLTAVEDSGSGIDSKILDRIFDPMFTTKAEGVGLGLSICRSIIEAHGGRLWAAPNPAGGSVFRFSIPGAMDAALEAKVG